MKELQLHVERIVAAVRASPARRRRMRQELLGHVLEIYQQERARGTDEALAVKRAIEKFAEPVELARELERSVPIVERTMCRLFLRGAGEGAIRHALRQATLAAVFIFCAMQLAPLVPAAMGKPWAKVRVGVWPVALVSAWSFSMVLLGYGSWQSMGRGWGRSSVVGGVASWLGMILAAVGLVAGCSVVQPDNAIWEFALRWPIDPYSIGLWGFLAVMPAVALMVTKMMQRLEMGRRAEIAD